MKNKTISTKEKASNKIKKTILSLLAITAIGQGVFSYVKNSPSALNLLNSNDEVKQNCEILGVDYSNLEMANLGAIKYYLTGKEDNNTYLSIPVNRCVPEEGNIIKVYIDKNFSKQYQDLAIECINEINYIAKNIDDPILYEYEIGSGNNRRECDITIVKKTEKKVHPNNKTLDGEAKALSYKIVNGVVTGLYPTMEIAINENENNENNFQCTVLHEFAHLIYGARDVFMKENKEISTSNFEEAKNYRFNVSDDLTIKKRTYSANASNSIMNGNSFFSAGDILLWSAKNTKNLKDNEEKIKNFAQNYQTQNVEFEFREFFNEVSKNDTKLEKLQLVRNKFENSISNYMNLCDEDLFVLEFYKLFKKNDITNLEEQIENEISKTIKNFDSSKLENLDSSNLDSFKNNNFLYLTTGSNTDCVFVMPDGNFVLIENIDKNLNKVDVSKCYLFKQYENSVVKIGIDLKNKNKVESIEISSKPSQEQEQSF